MSSIQVADQTFVAAPGAAVAQVLADRARWRRWWPDLSLDVREDRGDKGIRWTVSGPVTGTMEVWLEEMLDGVILHYFMHAEPPGTTNFSAREMTAANRARRVAGKRMSFEIKERLEAGRPAGVAPSAR
ncbi:polyketide cyclase / dehydrase and lipid transport [Nocardia sp. NPDC050406]|uniref:polyketide cyclase / dehydrase and lipid transport n=1 Tax=Nocardia sp. NPDC050406 TaxID=3364318 RepID=UPI0037B4C143